jgi:hypothetical protein
MGFWKSTEVLVTYRGFGNLWGFWKPIEVLETYGGFGNLWGFWKPKRLSKSPRLGKPSKAGETLQGWGSSPRVGFKL